MSKLLFAAAAGLLSLAAPAVAPALAAPAMRNAAEEARTAVLQRTAVQAEAKINQSAEARAALAPATAEAARAVLLRNGFTARQLEGVPIRVEKVSATEPSARIRSITIKVSCCPPEIVIIIRF